MPNIIFNMPLYLQLDDSKILTDFFGSLPGFYRVVTKI